MVYQKKMNTNGHKIESPDRSHREVNLSGNLSDVAHDVTRLMELQGRLMVIDVSEMRQKLKLPLILACVGVLCCLCALPLLFVAIAQGLILAGLSAWAAYALVGVGGIAIGILLLWQGSKALKLSLHVLDRSRAEFTKNVQWLKQMLRQHSASVRERQDR